MKVIKTWDELPYPDDLLIKMLAIRFKNDKDGYGELSLDIAIMLCNIIRGIIESNDYYVLMDNSEEMYNAIAPYGFHMFNDTIAEFTERKKNRIYKSKIGLLDLPLGRMSNWYCNEYIWDILELK